MDRPLDTKSEQPWTTPKEVYEAIIVDTDREARWVKDEEHGTRLMVMGTTESTNKLIIAYLDPENEFDGIWSVRTAWRIG